MQLVASARLSFVGKMSLNSRLAIRAEGQRIRLFLTDGSMDLIVLLVSQLQARDSFPIDQW